MQIPLDKKFSIKKIPLTKNCLTGQVVILAGGLGTRLRPLTHQIPKVMVSIQGEPFLEYILELLKKNNFKKIVLCVGYLGEKIKNYFGNGENLGIDIKYSFEKEKLLGTGGALKKASYLLENEFLLLFGDTFLNIDYQGLISSFHEKERLGMMVVYQNQSKIVSNNVEIDEQNIVVSYNKRKEGRANCVDAGVQVFKKDIINLIPTQKQVSLEEEIFPVLIQKKELIAYPTSQKFYDIGTFERLKIFSQTL